MKSLATAEKPEDVYDLLHEAADMFDSSALDLESAWQDSAAGRPWAIIARELRRCAGTIKREVSKGYAWK